MCVVNARSTAQPHDHRPPCRYAFPARLLVGLRRYQVAGDLSPAQKPRGKKVKSKKKEEEETSDIDNLLLVPTTFKETWALRFYNLYDGLVR